MSACDPTLGCPWINFKLRERRKRKLNPEMLQSEWPPTI